MKPISLGAGIRIDFQFFRRHTLCDALFSFFFCGAHFLIGDSDLRILTVDLLANASLLTSLSKSCPRRDLVRPINRVLRRSILPLGLLCVIFGQANSPVSFPRNAVHNADCVPRGMLLIANESRCPTFFGILAG